MQQIAKTLKQLMDRDGINQTDLSSATGVPQPTIHRILSGVAKDPRSKTVAALAKHFGLSADDMRDGRLEQRQVVDNKIRMALHGASPMQYKLKKEEELPELTPEAVELAMLYMQLPKKRREAYRNFLFVELAATAAMPWLNPDLAPEISYAEFQKRLAGEVAARTAALNIAK